MQEIPQIRIRTVHDASMNPQGDYVLYWMIASRRGTYNFSLQRAVQLAQQLNKPLVIFEALRCGYRWASDRLHRFILQGMADNARHFANSRTSYYPYVELRRGDGAGLLRKLASRACAVVTDDFPCFFLPRMTRVAAKQVAVRFELVDTNGLLPMRAADKVFARAYDFRRFLQKNLLPHLVEPPEPDPLHEKDLPTATLPADVLQRWPQADLQQLLTAEGLRTLPIDHAVSPVATTGGAGAACSVLADFIQAKLAQYDANRNQPELQATSGLSPYLHFGHISCHQIFEEITSHCAWTPNLVAEKATGSSSGWWGAPPEVESFLDEMITWRELGYNMCWQREDYDQFESLPDWAQRTLAEHEQDPRHAVYSLDQFEDAMTHDELWNASQRQLVREGRIHNYLRMLWGKKILEWSATPRDALDVMIELNNKYALDGRNPNSYSGIFWVLGRYDRAWGPERSVFGKVRYMSSDNTARKVKVKGYLARYAASSQQSLGFR